jgi:glucose/arabinose dehydrogenase
MTPRALPGILAGLTLGLTVLAATSPASAITTERVASGLNRPIFVTAPGGDDRLFIVEQRGVIKILETGNVLPVPFLDIDALVPNISGNDERGLLGLAFHPDYAQNGYFYVNYTNNSSDTVVARYSVSGDPNVADAGSALILITIDQPFSNHNGGTVAFSPIDGYLYIGMGDGGSGGDPQNNGQRDNTLLGKLLRLDVDCAAPPCIPPDNPYVGPGDPLDEIWAKGVRNPYRFSFDRATGDMYIGEVGQGTIEEVDFQPAASVGGENYGWRIMEGTLCFDNNVPPGCNDPSLTPPIHEYTHAGSPFRCSITGGYVYRGNAIPALQGTYFFADWCSNQIWSFRYVGGQVTEFTERTTELVPDVGVITNIAGFGEDGSGELYIVDRSSTSTGEVFKIIPESTGVGDPAGVPSVTFNLFPATPNPFSTSTQIGLELAQAGEIRLEVYDTSGRLIRDLGSMTRTAGAHLVAWDGHSTAGSLAPSGIYFLRAEMGGQVLTQRLQLLR